MKTEAPFCPMRNTLREAVVPSASQFCDTLGDLMQVWIYLIGVREQACKVLPELLWATVKEECDDLFRQASGGRFKICPSVLIGGVS